MIDSITRITLNLQETNTMVSIMAKRGDTGRKLLIHLSDGSIPYHISDDCYATFTAKKPDGTKINNACTIENNVIEYEFTDQTCTAVGTMKAEIRLYGADDKMITSACFLVNVYDTVFRDGDEVDSEGEMNTLNDLILRANAFLNETGKLLRWQGNWDSESEYEANDLVLHEDVLYVAEEAIAAGTAPGSEEVTAWVPIAGMGTGSGADLTAQVDRAEAAAQNAESAAAIANNARSQAQAAANSAGVYVGNAVAAMNNANVAAATAEAAKESVSTSVNLAGGYASTAHSSANQAEQAKNSAQGYASSASSSATRAEEAAARAEEAAAEAGNGSGGNASALIVRVERIDDGYVSSHTSDEICDAWDNGECIYCVLIENPLDEHYIFHPVAINSSNAIFTADIVESGLFVVIRRDAVNLIVSERLNRETIEQELRGYVSEDEAETILKDYAKTTDIPTDEHINALIDSKLDSGGQSDWDAAEGESGHILNRPFYTESGGGYTIVVPDTNMENSGHKLPRIGLVVGDLYRVTIDGTVYELTAFVGPDGWVRIDPDRSYFIIRDEPGKSYSELITHYPYPDTANIRVEHYGIIEIVHKIPEKYLPDGYGSGGNVDYTALENKPKINGVELSGNKSLEDLGIGQPTDEQIGSAVSAYLDEHPEATTTVQNGSITEEKLSDSVIKRIDGNAVFSGKIASFYGDSLTEVNSHYKKGYHSWVKDLLGLAAYNNYGKSGYKVSDVYSKVNSVTDTADIVFVMCGVNDQTFSVPLGVMGDNTTGTTYGALNLLCALLKQKYPTSIVVFITPHYQTKYPHSNGITSYEVSKAIRDVCEKYAITVYDNFVFSGIYSTNLSVFTTDNCHWNDTGHEMVGKNLAKFVTDFFRYVYGNTSGESGGGSGNEGEEDTTVSVTSVFLNVSSGTLTVGESVTLIATVLPSNATNKNVTWNSDDNSVATVSGGTVSAISKGTATITATTEDGNFTASYVLTVDAEETPDASYPEPKTVEITGVKNADWHLSLYISKEDLPSINNVKAAWGFDITPITEMTVAAKPTGGYFTVDVINDLLKSFDAVGSSSLSPVVTDNGDGSYHVTLEDKDAKTSTNRRSYWIFPINMSGFSIGTKFVLSNYYVDIGGVKPTICAIGGAFKEETCTVT